MTGTGVTIQTRPNIQTGAIPVNDPDLAPETSGCLEYTMLVELYVLAEIPMDENTKETVPSAILARSTEAFSGDQKTRYPGPAPVRVIDDGTPEANAARKLMVQLYTGFGNISFLPNLLKDLLTDFFYDLSVSLIAKCPLIQSLEAIRTKCSSVEMKLSSKTEQGITKESTIQTLKDQNSVLAMDLDVTKNLRVTKASKKPASEAEVAAL
jgi:hypothetical protein